MAVLKSQHSQRFPVTNWWNQVVKHGETLSLIFFGSEFQLRTCALEWWWHFTSFQNASAIPAPIFASLCFREFYWRTTSHLQLLDPFLRGKVIYGWRSEQKETTNEISDFERFPLWVFYFLWLWVEDVGSTSSPQRKKERQAPDLQQLEAQRNREVPRLPRLGGSWKRNIF